MAIRWKAYVFIKRYFWILLAFFSLLLRWLGSFYPQTIETFYSRGLFLGIRTIIDYTVATLPIPLFYLFFLILFYGLARYCIQAYQKKWTIKERLRKFGFHSLNFVSIIIIWFLWIWGFNYGRVPIENQLQIELTPPNLNEIQEETQWATKKTLDARLLLVGQDSLAIDDNLFPKDLEKEIRQSLERVLEELGYPTSGNVRARQLFPKGILLRIQTAGIYWFFVGEGNLDAGLHPLQKPFTMAHEMAHGYGFGDEGTCNFLAYLTCLESKQVFIRYTGMLAYWRYIASEYRYRSPKEYADFRATHLSVGMKNDLSAIYENNDLYPNILPSLREASYDTYLKLQGIEEGIENYNRMVILVKGWKKR